jgi:hypothetical protein
MAHYHSKKTGFCCALSPAFSPLKFGGFVFCKTWRFCFGGFVCEVLASSFIWLVSQHGKVKQFEAVIYIIPLVLVTTLCNH